VPITTGWGVRWDAGEHHASGTETGLVALAIEGASLDLFEPEEPERDASAASNQLSNDYPR
jgi:hypothetical protein